MWVNVCGIIEMRRWISTCQLFCCENHNAPKVWHNLKARNLHPAMPKFQQVAMIWVYLQDCIPSHRFWSSLILGHFLWTNHFPKLSEFHWGSWYVKKEVSGSQRTGPLFLVLQWMQQQQLGRACFCFVHWPPGALLCWLCQAWTARNPSPWAAHAQALFGSLVFGRQTRRFSSLRHGESASHCFPIVQ